MKAKFKAFLTRLQGIKQAISGAFGVPELLFLTGFGGFFYGLSGIWSLYGAFTACGAILMSVAILAIIFSQPRGE
jgi:hypothetical protein